MSLIPQWLQRKATVNHLLLGTQLIKLMNLLCLALFLILWGRQIHTISLPVNKTVL